MAYCSVVRCLSCAYVEPNIPSRLSVRLNHKTKRKRDILMSVKSQRIPRFTEQPIAPQREIIDAKQYRQDKSGKPRGPTRSVDALIQTETLLNDNFRDARGLSTAHTEALRKSLIRTTPSNRKQVRKVRRGVYKFA